MDTIQFLTPVQRHLGLDQMILSKRKNVYELVKTQNPNRWTQGIINWTPVTAVYLNPEKNMQNQHEIDSTLIAA